MPAYVLWRDLWNEDEERAAFLTAASNSEDRFPDAHEHLKDAIEDVREAMRVDLGVASAPQD